MDKSEFESFHTVKTTAAVSGLGSRRECIERAFSVWVGLVAWYRIAMAVPSYARQTGQPCAACHTVFPELTAYGRRFKMLGYTAGGTACGDRGRYAPEIKAMKEYLGEPDAWPFKTGGWTPPISGMMIASFTHLKTSQDPAAVDGTPFGPNDNLMMQQMSGFYAGQIYCDVGAFIQGTHEFGATAGFSLDNADVRFARDGTIGGVDVVVGVSLNTTPTVQDLWNTTPAWSYPYAAPLGDVAPGENRAGTLIEGGLAQKVVGTSAYVFLNNMLYLEAGAYRNMDPRTKSMLGQDMSDPASFDKLNGLAPYWRAALEFNRDEHSLMFGTFGMIANIIPHSPDETATGGNQQGDPSLGSDRYSDIGVDIQYQYLGDVHGFSLRTAYIHENQHLETTFNQGGSANLDNTLNSFKVSGTYIYEKALSFTATFFKVWGSADEVLYGFAAQDGVTPNTPNAQGWTAEIAWSPWMTGSPGPFRP